MSRSRCLASAVEEVTAGRQEAQGNGVALCPNLLPKSSGDGYDDFVPFQSFSSFSLHPQASSGGGAVILRASAGQCHPNRI